MLRRALFAFALTGSFASLAAAEDAPPAPVAPAAPVAPVAHAKVPLRVVRVMAAEHQALLFDRELNKNVLAEVGGTVSGFSVDEIADDEVSLSRDGAQVVLAAPDQSWRKRRLEEPTVALATSSPTVPTISAPIASAPIASASAPIDPYAESGPVRAVEAPAAIGADTAVRTAEAPTASTPDTATATATATATVPVTVTVPATVPVPATVTAPVPVPVPVPVPAPAPATTAAPATLAAAAPATAPADADPADPADAPLTLSRRDVTVALSDFARLTSSLRGAFTPAGARIDSLADTSIFARAGLRPGDLITAVDGLPLGSIDDAAELYVRIVDAHTVTVALTRAGKPQTLRLSIQ